MSVNDHQNGEGPAQQRQPPPQLRQRQSDKAVEAAQEQLESIRKLQRAGLLDQLPDKLQLTAALRLENPELTLSELAEEFDPPVTKSCLNHRLRKIQQLAKGL